MIRVVMVVLVGFGLIVAPGPASETTRAALQEYTGSTEQPGAVKADPPAEGGTPSPEAPTSDLGEPVATERRP